LKLLKTVSEIQILKKISVFPNFLA